MQDIVLISAPEVLKITIRENNEELVSLFGHPGIVVDMRKQRPKEQYVVRTTVLVKLLEAQHFLPYGMKFLAIESFRPLSLQTMYFKDYSKELKRLHPEWDSEKIYAEASKFVAPPEIIPPHSTGGAVDLTLRDEKNEELDMGTELNADPEESKNACFTFTHNISDRAKANRKFLIDAMSKSGFVNYPTEWWHWSYGDRYWAFITKSPCAIYGSVEE